MKNIKIFTGLGALVFALIAVQAFGQVAEAPAYTKKLNRPNVMFLLDNSGSMISNTVPGTGGLTRLQVLKNVLTGAGMVQYTMDTGELVWYIHKPLGTAGTHAIIDDLVKSRVHIFRVDWDTVRISRWSTVTGYWTGQNYSDGPYFVFYSLADAQSNNTNVEAAKDYLDTFLREQGKPCIHLVATADVQNDGLGGTQRQVWEASDICSPGPDYLSFGYAFREYLRYEETGVVSGGTIWVVPITRVVADRNQTWVDASTGTTRTGVCYARYANCHSNSCWNDCFKPTATSTYVAMYDEGNTVSEEYNAHKMTLADWAAANGNAEAICAVDQMEIWGDEPYANWQFWYTGLARSDGNTDTPRNIFGKCNLGDAGAVPTLNTNDDDIRAEMIAELRKVKPVDRVPTPDGGIGPEFIFDTSGSMRIDEYARAQLGLPAKAITDIDLNDPDFGGFFDNLYYDPAEYDSQGIMDIYPDVNYGLMVYDNQTSCTGDDFPKDSSGNCVGGKLIWNLDGWADFPAYNSTYAVDALNQQLQKMITGTVLDPPGSGALTPIASALHDAYRYFYNTGWGSGWSTTTHPTDKVEVCNSSPPYTCSLQQNHNMFYDLGYPTADGSEGDHIVQDDPYFHTLDPSVEPCRRNFLVFLTDGDQTQGETESNQTYWTEKLANDGGGSKPSQTGVKTYVIGFGGGLSAGGYAALTAIAEASVMSDIPDDIDYFFQADDQKVLFRSFAVIFNAIMQGSYARTAPRISSDGDIGITSFFDIRQDYPLWQGHLQAWQIPTDGSNTPPQPLWSPDSDAADILKTNTNRRLFFSLGTDYNDIQSEPFTVSNILALDAMGYNNPMNPTLFYSDTVLAGTVALVRNDPGAMFASGDTLQWALGPNFHSQPQIVGPPDSGEYSDRPGYSTFKSDHAGRDTLIYVGSGYGMLSAFDINNGNEVFGYLPQGVLRSLPMLYNGSQIYGVDGTPVIDDAYGDFNHDGNPVWRTILTVGLGGGGTTYSALDVTDASVGGADASVAPMWNFRNPKLGEAWSAPVSDFIKVNSQTENATFFGGGLSPGGTADVGGSFFIINTATAQVLKEFDLWDKDQVTDLKSLSLDLSKKNYNQVPGAPVILDADQDTYYDWAYVGDNEGRIWKINYHDPDPANWTQCLFYDVTDTNVDGVSDDESRRQPIWYSPTLATGPNNTLLVYFSTGHIETSDASQGTSDTYRLYALQDSQALTDTGCQYASTIPESLTGATVNIWPKAFEPGERLIASPIVTQGYLIFQTWVPNAGVACSEGQMRLWIIDYLTGQAVWDFGNGVQSYITTPNSGSITIDPRGNIWSICLSPDCQPLNKIAQLNPPTPSVMSWGEGVSLPF